MSRPDGVVLNRRRWSAQAWSVIANAAPQAVTFVLTPLLLHALGADGFGVWVFVQTSVVLLGSADAGLSTSVLRFLAVHRGAGDRGAATRLVFTTVLAYLALGLLMAGVIAVVGPVLAHGVSAADLRVEAGQLTVPVTFLLLATLLNGLFAALIAAHARFRVLGLTTLATSVVFAVTVGVVVREPNDLSLLAYLAAGQAAVNGAALLLAGLPHLNRADLRLISRSERQALLRYSLRAQVANLSALVNTEVDVLIVAALLPIRYVGYYGVGAAVAATARSLPLYAIPPLTSGLAATFGAQGGAATLRDFADEQRRWLRLVAPYAVVVLASLPFALPAWLGRTYTTAGYVALILFAGFSVNLVTAPSSSLVRALGRAGLEARYGVVSVLINVALTVPLAIAAGLYGIVTGTAVGAVVGSMYFLHLVRRHAGVTAKQFVAGLPVPVMVACGTLTAAAQTGLFYLHLDNRALWLLSVAGVAAAALALAAVLSHSPVDRSGQAV